MKHVLQKSAASQKPRGHLDPAGFDRHVEFHTYKPPADLAPFLEHFWTLRWDEAGPAYNSEQVMHRPYVDVFLSRDWSGIQGTFRSKRTYEASGKGRIIGARFLPGAFHCLWAGKMSTLQDRIIDLQTVFPEIDEAFVLAALHQDDKTAIQLLLQCLRARLPEPDPKVALIQRIIAATESDDTLQTVSAVAAAFGKSERWLQQLFQEYVGTGLKWLLQRNKLLVAATEIRAQQQPDWSAIAYDAGYSSQQHFISDFKKVVGKTPRQYKLATTPR